MKHNAPLTVLAAPAPSQLFDPQHAVFRFCVLCIAPIQLACCGFNTNASKDYKLQWMLSVLPAHENKEFYLESLIFAHVKYNQSRPVVVILLFMSAGGTMIVSIRRCKNIGC